MIARLLRAVLAGELLAAATLAAVLREFAHWSLFASLATALAVPLALHLVIVLTGFAFSRAVATPVPALQRVGAIGAFKMVLGEMAASLRVFQLTQPVFAHRAIPAENTRPWSPGCPVPVLLLHGYGCNRQVWRPLARWLASCGHAISAIDLEPAFGSIDAYAPGIAQAVDDLCRRTGAPAVALVCHSMGGLAARAFLRTYPGRNDVAAVITLGTPHRGTALASLALGENARQMRLGSAWLQSLFEDEPLGAYRNFTLIFSHHDNIVAPQADQHLPGAQLIALHGVGHLMLTSDPRVRPMLARSLANAVHGLERERSESCGGSAMRAGRPPPPG